jgi:thiamine-phosphate diphosphorylase
MRPVICLITDGRLRTGQPAAPLVARVETAARAGVHLVQIREHALDDRALLDVVRQCLDAARGTPTRVIVNDRLDVALIAGAHGVHLKSESFPAHRARAIVPGGFLLGRSVHSPDDAAVAAESCDYLLFGTVFESLSKPGRMPAGCAALEAAVRATAVPVLAVGGITPDNAGDVARTGAAGVAAIGLFTGADMPSAIARVARAFDLPIPGS